MLIFFSYYSKTSLNNSSLDAFKKEKKDAFNNYRQIDVPDNKVDLSYFEKFNQKPGTWSKFTKQQFEENVKLPEKDKQLLRKRGFLINYHGYDIEETENGYVLTAKKAEKHDGVLTINNGDKLVKVFISDGECIKL